MLQESGEDRSHLRLEPKAEALPLAFVSKRGLEDLELGLRRHVESPHSANGAKVGQQLLAYLGPGTRCHPAAPVCSQALGYDLAMPIRNGDLFRMLGEMVPERLDVFELLVWRQLVETRRGKRGLCHDSSIAAVASTDLFHATTGQWRPLCAANIVTLPGGPSRSCHYH
jgi:hypothetical protein